MTYRIHIQLPELLKRDFDFNVVIILDGWDYVSESMRLYLQVHALCPSSCEQQMLCLRSS